MFTGKQFGRYEIRSKIGAGGMGEVYVAYDQELDRNAAIKILPSEFSSDENRKARFRQEARAVSALNHPNIITIYEIADNEHGCYIVTELIDGSTLRETMRDRSLTLLNQLKLVEQAANALVAAHGAYIVHRDIKPENIMMRRDGIVKILDFGLAKPTAVSDGKDQDLVNTIPGMVMGSVRYMSPEQARGQVVDERTDIWSLGVVLYEMVAGTAPFDGGTTSDTIGAVIFKEPMPLPNIVADIPSELDRIVRKALQKDREARYQNVKDLALDLKALIYNLEHEISIERMRPVITDPAFSENQTMIHQTNSANHPTMIVTSSPDAIRSVPPAQTAKMNSSAKYLFGAIAGLLLLSVLGYGFLIWMRSGPNTNSFERIQVSRIDSDGKVALPAISPDGRYIAFASGDLGNRSLVVRQLATNSVLTIVPPTNLEFRSIAFSPSGDHIYYTQMRSDFSINILYQVTTLGGTPKKLIEDVDSPVTFSPDGKSFAFMRHVSKGNHDLLFTVNTETLEMDQVHSSEGTAYDFISNRIAWSPDGKRILMGVGKRLGGFSSEVQIAELSLADKKLNVIEGKKWFMASNFVWARDGSAFFFCARESRNLPIQVWRASYPAGDVRAVTSDFDDYNEIGLTADGKTLVAVHGEAVASLWRFTPATKENVQLTADNKTLDGSQGLRQLPNGQLVFTRQTGNKFDFWLSDVEGKDSRAITADMGFVFSPRPSADGRYVVFTTQTATSSRIWRMDADGKNAIPLTEENPTFGDFNPNVTADSRTVIFHRNFITDERQMLMKVSIDGGPAEVLQTDERYSLFQPRISPDGKYLAYACYETVTFERRLRIASLDGDKFLKIEYDFENKMIDNFDWSPDGKSLTIQSNRNGVPNLWRMPLSGGEPTLITDFKSGRIFNYSWSIDGKSIFLTRGIVTNDLMLIRDSAQNNSR